MSGSGNDLNVRITATDSGAQASIRALQSTIASLQGQIQAITREASGLGREMSATAQTTIAGINATINSARAEIAVLQQQAGAVRNVTAAVREQTAAVSQLGAQMRNQAQAAMEAAAASARGSAVAVSGLGAQMRAQAQARMDAATAVAARPAPVAAVSSLGSQMRAEAQARMDMQQEEGRREAEYINRSMDMEANAARQRAAAISAANRAALDEEQRNARAMAEYENQHMDAVASRQRAEAEYENQSRNAIAARQRAEAEYENAMRDAVASRSRSEAEYENRSRDALAAKTRAEAEYENASRDAIMQRDRLEAEYTNRAMEMAANRDRAEAEYENRRIDAIYRRQRAEAEYMNAQMDAAARASRLASRESDRSGGQNLARHGVSAFDELARGQRGALVSTMGATMRDAGLGAAGLTAAMGGLVAIMGASAIVRGAENLGKWAIQTRAAASAAGMSVSAYSELQGALSLTGLKGEEADSALRRLAESLSKALADPASLSAQAFHNLTISQEALVATSGDVGKLLPMLADGFSRTADGANKSANMEELAGRGFERLIPALNKGSEGFKALEAEAKAMGITLDEQAAKKLELVGQEADKLSARIRGEGIQAFVAWNTEILGFIRTLEALGAGIGYISSAIANLGPNIASTFSSLNALMGVTAHPGANMRGGSHGIGAKTGDVQFGPGADVGIEAKTGSEQYGPFAQAGALGNIPTAAQLSARDVALAGLNAANKGGDSKAIHIAETTAEIAEIQKRVAAAKEGSKEKIEAETELFRKQTSLRNEQAPSAGAGNKAARQSTEDFIAAEKEKLAEAKGNSQEILAIYNDMLSQLGSKYKATAAQISQIEREKVQTINAAKIQEIAADASRDRSDIKGMTQDQTLASMAAGTFTYAGQEKAATPDQDKARSAQYIAEAEAVQTKLRDATMQLTAMANSAEAGSNVQKDAQAKLVSVTEGYKAQEIALYEKAGAAAVEAANKIAKPWLDLGNSIGGAIETLSTSLIKDLIAPSTTLIKAGLTTIKYNDTGDKMRAAFGTAITSIAGDFGKAIESAVGNFVAKSLSNIISGVSGNTMGELLSSGISKLFSSITGNAVGSVAGSAAGSATGAAASSAPVVAGLVANSTTTVTGVTASLTASTTLVTSAIAANAVSISGAIAASTATDVAAQATVHPSAAGFSLAGGGVIPSAAGGMTTTGTGGTLAVLHEKEMVLPKPISEGIQGMIARGGQNNTNQNARFNYSPTINTGSRGRQGTGMTRGEFQQMLAGHSSSFLGEARNMMRNGWRPA